MSNNSNRAAFEFLQDIERRSFESAQNANREEDLDRYWRGISFRMAGIDYLVRLNEVAEIISIPRYTRVPGAKSWVIGLANIRGTLLPILDLHGFLGRKAPHSLRRQRLLVVDHDNIHCGIVVDEVLGLNHFEHESWVSDCPIPDDVMTPYVNGGFYSGERLLTVFSLKTLAEAPTFRQVALI